jgi:DNA-directed RNA polymerase I subunit RPA2
MHPISSDFGLIYPYRYLPVTLDGVILGYVDPRQAPELVRSLRALKIQQIDTNNMVASVPKSLEVAYLPPTATASAEAGDNPEEE